MSTSKKINPLFILIALSIVLFVFAIIWKQFSVDNSEKITPTISKTSITNTINSKIIKTPLIQNTNETPSLDINENLSNDKFQYEKEDPSNQKLADPDSKIKRAKLGRTLNMHLMLKTPEQTMEVIKSLQQKGKNDLANEYLDYLLKTFPDYKIKE